jgi:hypothetical protein
LKLRRETGALPKRLTWCRFLKIIINR